MEPIKIKKAELAPLLINIASLNPETGEIEKGLLVEEITLGTKRILGKIRKALIVEYQEFENQIKEVKKECGEDKEKLQKELEELYKEEVEITVPRFKFEMIENVSSEQMYDFDLLEKIAE